MARHTLQHRIGQMWLEQRGRRWRRTLIHSTAQHNAIIKFNLDQRNGNSFFFFLFSNRIRVAIAFESCGLARVYRASRSVSISRKSLHDDQSHHNKWFFVRVNRFSILTSINWRSIHPNSYWPAVGECVMFAVCSSPASPALHYASVEEEEEVVKHEKTILHSANLFHFHCVLVRLRHGCVV